MKIISRLLICLFGLLFAWAAWAAKPAVQIQVHGISGDVQANVKKTLTSITESFHFPLSPVRRQQLRREAHQGIKKSLQPFGYFRAQIHTHLFQKSGKKIYVTTILPGRAMHVSKVDIKIMGAGQSDPSFQRVIKNLALKVGQQLNSEYFTTAKQRLMNLATKRGYFKAKMSRSKLIINLHTYSAQAILHLFTGPRFHYGSTHFSKSPFYERFLRRFLRYKKGAHYNNERIQQTQMDLANSDYFTQATVDPKPNQKNLTVPIHIYVNARKRYKYTAGLGFGTDTGVRGTLGAGIRYVNGYGHRFNTLLRASKVNSSLVANYIIPGPHPATDELVFSAGAGRLSYNKNTENSNSVKFSVSYTNALTQHIQQTIALTYLNERYNLRNLPKTNARILYPSIHWRSRYTDKDLNPNNGYSLDLSLAGAPEGLTSSNGFTQARANGKLLLTFFHNTRLLTRASFGRTDIKLLQNLPLSLQLFAGGTHSIRGYGYNDIGPGRNLLVGSVEIQQRIYGSFYLAAFFDAGTVGSSNVFKQQLSEGIGPAIVWLSPVGALEISVAQAITSPGKPWSIQFSMGPQI